MGIWKRFICGIMAMIMVISLLPVSALAAEIPEEPEGLSEEAEPMEVQDCADDSHVWDEGMGSETVITYTCTICGATREEELEIEVPPDEVQPCADEAHIWDEGVSSETVVTYTCTVCGAIKEEPLVVEEPSDEVPLCVDDAHVWDEGKGSETGITYTCIVCGATREEIIEAENLYASASEIEQLPALSNIRWGTEGRNCGEVRFNGANYTSGDVYCNAKLYKNNELIISQMHSGEFDDPSWELYSCDFREEIINNGSGDYMATLQLVHWDGSYIDYDTMTPDIDFAGAGEIASSDIFSYNPPSEQLGIPTGVHWEYYEPGENVDIGNGMYIQFDQSVHIAGWTQPENEAGIEAVYIEYNSDQFYEGWQGSSFDYKTGVCLASYDGWGSEYSGSIRFRMKFLGDLTHYADSDWSAWSEYNTEAQEPGADMSGECGDNLIWELEEDGTLRIRGTGAMWDFAENIPWDGLQDRITSIYIPHGCTNISEIAFLDCANLIDIYLPTTVTMIGVDAFFGCNSLTDVNYFGTEEEKAGIEISEGNESLLNAAWHYRETQISGEFSYLNADTAISSYSFDYDENWFQQSSYTYQHALTKMSLRMAMAAGDASVAGGKSGDENIKRLIKELGFDYSDDFSTYPTPTYDSIGYALGSKEITCAEGEKCTLIAVAVRGSGYRMEWGGNFNIGTNTPHEGFQRAADQVLIGIQDYINSNNEEFNPRIKIWISGFSRAAATTNLVAASLDDGAIPQIEAEDVYAFCFECPQNTTTQEAKNSRYKNIVNVINPIDLVPKVAMSGWGFLRYGQNYYLPSMEESSPSNYYNLKDRMKKEYRSILSFDGNRDPDDVEEYTEELQGQSSALTDLMYDVAMYGKSREFYCTNYETGTVLSMGQIFGNGSPNTLGELIDALSGLPVAVDILIPAIAHYMFPDGNTLKAISFTPHYMELCMAWLDALDGDMLSKSRGTRKIFINCPVNVTVFADGKIVGKIIDNTPIGVENGIGTYIDGNGQKVIILPEDAEYRIELIATGEGKLTVTATERSIDTQATNRVVSYQEIPISVGDKLSLDVENLDAVSDAEYPLTLSNGEQAVPDVDMSGAAVQNYTVNVEATEGGSVYGGGSFVCGEYVQISATPEENYEFDGWFVGEELLSTDPEYRFLVQDNMTVTAHFSGLGHEHTYGDWTDCGDGENHTRTCATCGDTETAAHEIVIDEAVPPTHTTPGLTEGKHCSVCGAVLVAQTEIPPLEVDFTLTLDNIGDADTIWVDGRAYPVQKNPEGGSYVALSSGEAKTAVVYSYNAVGEEAHKTYPTGMRVWTLDYQDGSYTATYVPEFENLLQYKGSSIRITGNKGIRMITGVPDGKREQLIQGKLAGYTLEEYGTVLAIADQIENGSLTLEDSYAKSNYAYERNTADAIYEHSGGLIQYTNVLVGFTMDQCDDDIAMRPYMKLSDKDGNIITLYGGIVYRSIGYIAWQNKDIFPKGSDGYNYIWDIINAVYGDNLPG